MSEQATAVATSNCTAQISPAVRNKIIRALISGEYPVDSDIAEACKVPVSVVEKLLSDDPELRELRRQAERRSAQLIEKASIDLAINGKNQMARQKAQEFMLKHMMPDKYGDSVNAGKSAQSVKRIMIVKELPVVDVDENGIPIAKSRSPLEPKAIDVR